MENYPVPGSSAMLTVWEQLFALIKEDRESVPLLNFWQYLLNDSRYGNYIRKLFFALRPNNVDYDNSATIASKFIDTFQSLFVINIPRLTDLIYQTLSYDSMLIETVLKYKCLPSLLSFLLTKGGTLGYYSIPMPLTYYCLLETTGIECPTFSNPASISISQHLSISYSAYMFYYLDHPDFAYYDNVSFHNGFVFYLYQMLDMNNHQWIRHLAVRAREVSYSPLDPDQFIFDIFDKAWHNVLFNRCDAALDTLFILRDVFGSDSFEFFIAIHYPPELGSGYNPINSLMSSFGKNEEKLKKKERKT